MTGSYYLQQPFTDSYGLQQVPPGGYFLLPADPYPEPGPWPQEP
jgi:hypothetical protein